MQKSKSKTKSSKKQLIVQKTLECISKYGITKTTFSVISKKARIPHPLISYYFPTWESLFHEVVLLVLEDLKEHTLRSIEPYMNDPERLIEAYVRTPFTWAEKNQLSTGVWAYFYAETQHSAVLKGVNSSIRKLGRERIQAILYSGIAKNVFSPIGLTVEELAFQVQSLMTGSVIQLYSEEGLDPKKIENETVGLVLSMLGIKK